MTLALATISLSVVLTPAIREPWQFILLWGFVIGLSTGPYVCPPVWPSLSVQR
jgi:hypothetical protein